MSALLVGMLNRFNSFLNWLISGIKVQTEETHNDVTSVQEHIQSLNTECQLLRDKVHKLEGELKHRTLDTSQFDDSKIKSFTGLPNLQTFMLSFSYVSSVLPATAKQSPKPTQTSHTDEAAAPWSVRGIFRLTLWNSSVNLIKNLLLFDTCHGKQATSSRKAQNT